jgi:hypothetical protein
VDTGFAPANLVVNTLIGVSNICTIPFNAITEAAALPEEGFRALGASEQDIEAFNFGLMMTGVGEVAALPKLVNTATRIKNVATVATEVKNVATVATEAKNVATTATEVKNVAAATGKMKNVATALTEANGVAGAFTETKNVTQAALKTKNAATTLAEANKAAKVSTAGRVALDNNAIIARLEGAPQDVQAVVKAIAGSKPSVSIQAVKEFLAGKKFGPGKGDIKALRAFLIETGGGVGKAPSAATLKQLQGLGLKPEDAKVVGSAIEEGLELLTRDKEVLKKVPAVAKKF